MPFLPCFVYYFRINWESSHVFYILIVIKSLVVWFLEISPLVTLRLHMFNRGPRKGRFHFPNVIFLRVDVISLKHLIYLLSWCKFSLYFWDYSFTFLITHWDYFLFYIVLPFHIIYTFFVILYINGMKVTCFSYKLKKMIPINYV